MIKSKQDPLVHKSHSHLNIYKTNSEPSEGLHQRRTINITPPQDLDVNNEIEVSIWNNRVGMIHRWWYFPTIQRSWGCQDPSNLLCHCKFFFLPVIFYSTIEMLYNSKKNMLSIEYFSLKFVVKKLVSDSQILFLSLLWMDHHGLLLLSHGLCLLWNQYSHQLVDHL